MHHKPEELPLGHSPANAADADAVELARLWLVDGQPSFVVGDELWESPEMWGLLVASFIQYLSGVYQAEGFDRRCVLGRILTSLATEVKQQASVAG